jgi:hypothetical protein
MTSKAQKALLDMMLLPQDFGTSACVEAASVAFGAVNFIPAIWAKVTCALRMDWQSDYNGAGVVAMTFATLGHFKSRAFLA